MESKISSEFEVPRLGFLISGGLRPKRAHFLRVYTLYIGSVGAP